MAISDEALREMRRIDWDFPRPIDGTSQPLHSYPATFPPSLAATLVELLSKPGDVVLDPFGGIGTTVVEAVRLGRTGWTNDSNPVASLSAYAALSLVALQRLGTASDALQAIGANLVSCPRSRNRCQAASTLPV